ncbi:hypothetical protein SAMN04487857_113147 [Pseudomonas sp. ok272]|uniref:hypothetical protein n=1 Tax=unclassified Pseudomonas TaxID=196821 RepID=UPI0008BF6788|nr:MULTISPECIES: hypothetical protein [unclassified Pseudomonas]SEN32002.1 hypothetical protein SAMN04487857_113147 [Pseudomonas sp. ok272]SFN18874.1 hypothetical protein SAMN04487858_11423 [Pseudomonas sp. ok602]
MAEPLVLLLVMVLIHVLVDFVLPWKRWYAEVTASRYRVLVMAIYFIAASLALFVALALLRHDIASAATAALALAAGRAALYLLMPRQSSHPVRYFLLEQVVVLSAITLVWLVTDNYFQTLYGSLTTLPSPANLLILLAYLLVLHPTSTLIGLALKPWIKEIDSQGSLANAGKLIGNLERALILTFVLLKQWEAIGFLLTAKSILRFNEIQGAKVRSLSEYVLLGTLLSFTLSIAVGLLVTRLLGW